MVRPRLPQSSPVIRSGLLTLVPVVLLGLILAFALNFVLKGRAIEDAESRAAAVAAVVADRSGAESGSLSSGELRALRRELKAVVLDKNVEAAAVWTSKDTPVYAVGPRLTGGGERGQRLAEALGGQTVSHIGKLGSQEVLHVYTPLAEGIRSKAPGALELAIPYAPIASAVSSDVRKLWVLLFVGLLVVGAVLFFALGAVSNRLHREATEKEQQARHDPLTGLPNRGLFRELLEQALASRPPNGLVAVLLMDLDRFKEINDTLGHFNGDLVIQRTAKRLQSLVRGSDTVARLGGDEFAMLLTGMHERQAVVAMVERVKKALEEPFVAAGLALEVDASVGIALCPNHGDDVNGLLQKADVAMYAAKRAHTGFEFYAADQHRHSPAQLGLVAELRRAIDRTELVLHYQPKARLDTRQVDAVEALVRWQHRHRGLLPPGEFIPIAEQASLIRPVTLHLLEEGIRRASTWKSDGVHMRVAVNLSTQILLDLELSKDIGRMLFRLGAQPNMLEVEVTESAIMYDPRRAKVVLQGLHDMGVRIAIDDFGTGYSSLVSLKQLPVSTIKIDKSFVMGMDENDDDAAIVKSTVQLGHNLGLEVVAEGVETPSAWNQLAALRCDYAQGYYLSKPLEADKFMRWLSAYRSMIAGPVSPPSHAAQGQRASHA